jgi:predicted nucleic acid-binding protein
MAIFFFDSSGLVKRYIAEAGSGWIQSLNDAAAGHSRVVAQITGPEMIAAVTRRERRGDTTSAEAAAAVLEIEADFAGDYVLLEVSLARIQEAMRLARKHGLRGYDSVQLAAALYLRDQCRALNQTDPILITADKELLAAGIAEGMIVDDPNMHP